MTRSAAKKRDIFNSKFILREKRFVWLDYDKGISIILVAYGHCYATLFDHGITMTAYPFINYIGIFLYGFRMPLFFIVSGTLISRSLEKRGLSAYLVNRVNNILYPLLIWGGIEIILALISSRLKHEPLHFERFLDLLIDPRQIGHFWYLNALFFIGAIYSVLKFKLKLSPYIQLVIGGVLFAVAGYININDIDSGLFKDICQFYVFFALGDAISKIFFNEYYVKRFTSWKVFFPLLILFVIIQYKFTQLNLAGGREGINYVEHKLPWFYLFEALIGCALSISFSFLLQKYRVFSFLRVVGFHSLFIYCMQIIVMTFTEMILVHKLNITSVPVLFLSIWFAGIIIPMVFYNVCLKINAWWFFTFKKPTAHYDFVQQAGLQ